MRQIWIKSILKIRSFSSIIRIVKNQNISRLTKREILRKCCSSTISRFFCLHGKDEINLFVGAGTQRGPCAKRFSLDSRGGGVPEPVGVQPAHGAHCFAGGGCVTGFSAAHLPVEYARGLAVVKSFGRDIPLEHFDIAFDHVSFGYDDRQVLHDVSFTIPEKNSTAIVGPSSSGKTTLCFAVQRAEDLLRKVERVVFALLVGQARIRSKIFQRQGIFLCQRAGGS